MTETISAQGRNGQVYFDGKAVTIRREGFNARATHGRGDKVIPLRHVAAIQLKPVSFFTAGYIQFTVPGEMSNNKRKGGRTYDAVKDENAVVFLKSQEPAFSALRHAIQTALLDL